MIDAPEPRRFWPGNLAEVVADCFRARRNWNHWVRDAASPETARTLCGFPILSDELLRQLLESGKGQPVKDCPDCERAKRARER